MASPSSSNETSQTINIKNVDEAISKLQGEFTNFTNYYSEALKYVHEHQAQLDELDAKLWTYSEHELHRHQVVEVQHLHSEVGLVRKIQAGMMEEVKMKTKDFARTLHGARLAMDGAQLSLDGSVDQCKALLGKIKKALGEGDESRR